MKDDFSVAAVIPCYNSVQTIEECINSVLAQSAWVDELIIIDDGSKDDSISLIRRLFQSVPAGIRTVLIEQENQGPSAARNNGVKAASSAYIAFLDGDDKWFPDHIKTVKEFITRHDEYDIIATKYQSAPVNYSGEITFRRLLLRNYFLTPCVILKGKTFYQAGGFNERMRFAEDYYLWLTVIYKGQGYLLPYTGAANIENKRPFGDKGLSSNLRKMHKGVQKAYSELFASGKLSALSYCKAILFEEIKYYRRKLLSVTR